MLVHEEHADRESAIALGMPALSLELLAKKKSILESEHSKLEACLQQRSVLLYRLRQTCEALLTQNGKLESCVNNRAEKLQSLQSSLCADGSGLRDGDTGVSACTDKITICKELLVQLEKHRQSLESTSMELDARVEERVQQHQQDDVAYRLQNEQRKMLQEDIESHMHVIQIEKQSTASAEDALSRASCQSECDRLLQEQNLRSLGEMNALLEDRKVVASNIGGMIREDLAQLQSRRDSAETALRDMNDMLRGSGAILPQDFEYEESAMKLRQKLEQISIDIAGAKVMKRDGISRRKEERELLRVLMSTVMTREDQVQWLEKQVFHLKSVYETKAVAFQDNERAHQIYQGSCNEQMRKCTSHIEATRTEAKQVEVQIAVLREGIAQVQDRSCKKIAELNALEALRASKVAQLEGELEELASMRAHIVSHEEILGTSSVKLEELIRTDDAVRMSCEDEVSQITRATDLQARLEASIRGIGDSLAAAAADTNRLTANLSGAYSVDPTQKNAKAKIRAQTQNTLASEAQLLDETIEKAIKCHELAKKTYARRKTSYEDIYEDAIQQKRREYEALSASKNASRVRATAEPIKVARQDAEEERPTAECTSRNESSDTRVSTNAGKTKPSRSSKHTRVANPVQTNEKVPVALKKIAAAPLPKRGKKRGPSSDRPRFGYLNPPSTSTPLESASTVKRSHTQSMLPRLHETPSSRPIAPAKVAIATKVKKSIAAPIRKTSQAVNWLTEDGFSFS